MANVTVYSTPTCPYCTMAKDYLKEHNIAYADIDVSQDHAAAESMIKKSGQMGVPVITIEKDGKEDVIVGFDQGRMASILGL
ncbi:MAG TPA: glutaredoxin family protein [Patescibacteria group bacterium]|nr:glutaredoxin family protein [Patescibacteria group bacterium]